MRIHFMGIAHPRAIAISLKRELAAHGRDVGIRICEQHVAGMMGYDNWHHLRKVSKGRDVADPTDHDAGPEIEAARRSQYVDFLAATYGQSLASSVVDSIRPTGDVEPARGIEPAKEAAPAVAPDGSYPFAYSHVVATDGKEGLARSEGRIRIPSKKNGGRPAFSGEFLASMEIGRPALVLRSLEIHEVDGALYSALQPLPGNRADGNPIGADELADVMLWRTTPVNGAGGHPLVQALALARHRLTTNLARHVCPPGWDFEADGGDRGHPLAHTAFYGGVRNRSSQGAGYDAESEARGRGASEQHPSNGAGSPGAKDVHALRDDGDRIRAEIVAAVEGQLAIVGGEVMFRTPEPCWKLTMPKFGELRLDLHLSRYLRGRDAYEPTLFFALDEDEARDRALDSLTRYTGRTDPQVRGTLDSLDTSACSIDGNASSLAYLAACMRESLTQAARVLPAEAARAAESLRSRFPVEGYPNLSGFVARGQDEATLGDDILDGWDRLMRLAGDSIRMDSEVAALARLAGHGVFLSYLASTQPETLELA